MNLDALGAQYLLNLSRRPDRLRATQARVAAVGLTPERVAALDARSLRSRDRFANVGHRAHSLTLRRLLCDAERRQSPAVLVLEDDVAFHPQFAARLAGLTLPSDWRMFYLGCLHVERPEPVSPGIVRVRRALDTHAVVFRGKTFRAIREALAGRGTAGSFSDALVSDLHAALPTYAAYPNLAWQTPAGSDISGGWHCNYAADGRQVFAGEVLRGLPCHLGRLVPLDAFSPVLGPWRGANVRLYCDPWGNTGDKLIREAERQLFAHYGITQDATRPRDAIFFGAGGNMGGWYLSAARELRAARQHATAARVPLVILPQSWTAPDAIRGDVEFAREEPSRQHCPSAMLATDLGLAYAPDIPAVPLEFAERAEGFFFRSDREAAGAPPPHNLGDPARLAATPEAYVALAATCRRVHTDRLHFAVAALIAGRETILYANSYHKCRGVWEHSLRALGCEFREC